MQQLMAINTGTVDPDKVFAPELMENKFEKKQYDEF